MLLPTHIASGYLIAQVYINNFNLEGVSSDLITTIAIVGSLVSDVDGLFGKQLKNHRKTPLHTPLIWLLFILIIFLIGFITDKRKMIAFSTVFIIGILFHLFLDWFGQRAAGIRIFYPLSKKQYSLFPLNPQKAAFSVFPNRNNIKKYREFVKFYFKNKFLIVTEILIILTAMLIWVKQI